MRRMARKPEVRKRRPPPYPPPDTLGSFTQHGQCPVKAIRYYDHSKAGSNRPAHFKASTVEQLLEADRNGKVISIYPDRRRLFKPTLERYRQYIENAHVAVVGSAKPWAEAMLLNQGAGRITTLDYREFVIEHKSVVTVTPSQFAAKFLQATNDGKNVRAITFM